MIGQYYNKITLETIKSIRDDFIIIHGQFRSGKTTLVKETYKDYDIIECDANAEGFDRLIYSLLVNKLPRKLYLIQNCDAMYSGVFNKILKSAEEMTEIKSTLVMEYRGEYPETLKTRAKIINMSPYKKQELLNITDNDIALNISQSPGIIEYLLSVDNLEESYKMGCNIASNIGRAEIGNLLKVVSIIDNDKLDYITILLTIMNYYAVQQQSTEPFLVVSKLYYAYTLSNKINMSMAFTNMLIELKNLV